MPIALTGGGFKKPDGTNLSGILILRLPQDAKVTAANNQIVPDQINITVTNGNLVAGTNIYGTDELTPSGLYYSVMLENSNGRIVYGYDPPQKWQPTGGGTLDVGSIIPLSVTPAVSVNILPSPIQIGQTDTGLSRTAAGTVAVGNGTSGDSSGTVKASVFSAAVFADSTTPSNTGTLRLANLHALTSRNAANSGDVQIAVVDGADRIQLGDFAAAVKVMVASASGLLQVSSSGDTGLSRSAAGVIAIGNGTASDKSGTLALTSIQGPGLQKQIFTTNGTFTIPTGITQVKVTVVGGGGGGAGIASAAFNGSAGGGGGATAIKWLTGLTGGNTLAVTVGGGGAGGASGANAGASGTNSTVASGTQTITTVTGGAGSGASTGNASGGPGGTAANGDLNLQGGGGGYGFGSVTFQCPAGYGGGSTLTGDTAQGSGGAGVNGATNTGQGGGGASANTMALAGGNGGSGIVIFEWIS